MIWLLVLILAFFFYFSGKKLWASIILFFITGGYQFVPANAFYTAFGISKSLDFAIIFVVITFVVDMRFNFRILQRDRFAKLIIFFLCFILIAIVYSLLAYKHEPSSVLRASRKFFLLLIYFNYRRLSKAEFDKVFIFLRYLTVLQSIVFLLQIPLGTSLLNTGTTEGAITEFIGQSGTWTRYYNLPMFIMLFFFHGMFVDKSSGMRRWVVLTLFAATLLAPLHRSLIFSLLAVLILVGIRARSWNKNFRNILAVLLLAGAFFPALILERVEQGIDDFGNVLESGLKNPKDNLSFRLAHALERAKFTTTAPERVFFGSGFLTEDSKYTRLLNFLIAYRGSGGIVTQIDTSDISWSFLFLQTGLLGTLLYVWLYFFATRMMWNNRHYAIGMMGTCFFLMIFFNSFTSAVFVDTVVFVSLPLLIVVLSHSLRDHKLNQRSN